MRSEEEKQDRIDTVRLTWGFVVLAALLGFFVGLATTAAYEILREHWTWFSPGVVFVSAVVFSALFVDMMNYMIEQLRHDDHLDFSAPAFTGAYIFWRWSKMRRRWIA
jgi:hypothetical protein